MVGTTLTPKSKCDGTPMPKDDRQAGPRFMMWVDGVGGYLVCLGDEILLGQAVGTTGVDVPIMSDVSRRHAVLLRQSEGYLLRPIAATFVNGRPLPAPCILADRDEIRLGSSFRLRFRQPHPLSASARLEIVSHHRIQPSADGVILMAKSCLLGPSPRNHVVCRGWAHDIALVRQGQQLRCHAKQPFDVDGRTVETAADVVMGSRITGHDFCLSLEQID